MRVPNNFYLLNYYWSFYFLFPFGCQPRSFSLREGLPAAGLNWGGPQCLGCHALAWHPRLAFACESEAWTTPKGPPHWAFYTRNPPVLTRCPRGGRLPPSPDAYVREQLPSPGGYLEGGHPRPTATHGVSSLFIRSF